MGFLSRGVERKSASATSSLELFREIYGGRASKSGQTINLETAFRVSVAFACLKVLSQGGAQVPFKLYRETESSGMTKRAPAKDHSLYDLVATAPNDWTTSLSSVKRWSCTRHWATHTPSRTRDSAERSWR